MPTTNLAVSSNILWKLLEGAGHDPAPLFRRAGVEPATALDPDARIPSAAVESIQMAARTLLADPCLGLRAVSHWHPSDLGALGYAWLASSTLRAAMVRLQRYLKLVTGIMRLELQETPGGLRAEYSTRPGYADLPERYDFFAGLLVRMCRVNAGESFAPAHVTLVHERFPCCASYRDYFRCPVEFAAVSNTVTIARQDADRTLSGGNSQLAQLHDQLIVRYLARLDRDDIVQRVKGAVLDRLQSGRVADDDIAAALHVSVRTLQRKLQDAGTSFRDVVDETRREIAAAGIQDRNLSLGELAFMLGFSDASAFSRAYRRWTGCSPSRARAAGNARVNRRA